jgi:hypothetical protein
LADKKRGEHLHVIKISDSAISWLLDGDPAIRWQTLRDVVGAAESTVERERRQVARTGWGWRLLERQDPVGTWAGGCSSDGGLYSPKWISTTYTMLLLRDFGLVPTNRQARKACTLLLEQGMQRDGGINYGWSPSETCITGMVLSILSYFQLDDDRLDTLVDHLLRAQMPDGGWNCRRRFGATHASVHTTISVLEGLRHYELSRSLLPEGTRAKSRRIAASKRSRSDFGELSRVASGTYSGKVRSVRAAQARGREFLLVHRLFRSHRTGKIIKPIFMKFSFPPCWHYDILRALDYFQAVGATRDERLSDAIDIVRNTQREDGRWTLHNRYKGKTWFELERLGAPSRWNTLRALRVRKWWDGAKRA